MEDKHEIYEIEYNHRYTRVPVVPLCSKFKNASQFKFPSFEPKPSSSDPQPDQQMHHPTHRTE